MNTEIDCKADQRFLLTEEIFSNKTIEIWKKESINRMKDRTKDQFYHNYLNWSKSENEVALFTKLDTQRILHQHISI